MQVTSAICGSAICASAIVLLEFVLLQFVLLQFMLPDTLHFIALHFVDTKIVQNQLFEECYCSEFCTEFYTESLEISFLFYCLSHVIIVNLLHISNSKDWNLVLVFFPDCNCIPFLGSSSLWHY